MHFYRLVRYHTQRNVHASLSIRVSDSGHPVKYAIKFCRNKLGQKIIAACPYAPHNIIHFYIILRFCILRLFLRKPVIHSRYTAVYQHAPHIIICFHISLLFYIKRHFCASLSNAHENIKHFKICYKHTFEFKKINFIFLWLELGLMLGLELRSNHSLARNLYKSVHATTRVDSYFYFSL